MRSVAGIALVCAFCLSSASIPAARSATASLSEEALSVPHTAIATANAYWRDLGVQPPPQGYFLARPWSAPWSGRSLVVPLAWFKSAFQEAHRHSLNHTPTLVDAAALRADLPLLQLVMEKNYSGWETANEHGWNWNDWFSHWDRLLSSYGNKEIADARAFAPWFAYEGFQIDSHTGPDVPSRFGNAVTSASAMLVSLPSGECTLLNTVDGEVHRLDPSDVAQRPHRVDTWTGRKLRFASYIVYPSAFGKAKSLRCGKQTISALPFWSPYGKSPLAPQFIQQSVAALSGGQNGLALYDTIAPHIGYLRLAAFTDAGDEALSKLLQSLPPSAGHEKLLIVDLRNNDGGNAPIGLLSRWVPESEISRSPGQVLKRSCLYPGLWFNLGQVLSLGVKRPVSENFRNIMAAYGRNLMTGSSPGCLVSFNTVKGKWFYTEHHFVRHWQGKRPRLLVLVDHQCASDCEFMIWALAQLPGTVIAGENTLGVIGFTQPGFLLLPHSRIVFQLATSRSEDYGDGRSEDGYGLDVDVTLPTAAAWGHDSILALANSLANPRALDSIH